MRILAKKEAIVRKSDCKLEEVSNQKFFLKKDSFNLIRNMCKGERDFINEPCTSLKKKTRKSQKREKKTEKRVERGE